MLLQQIVNAISLGAVYALFALGFTLIFGVLEVVSLAQGAVFMAGAFAGLLTVNRLHLGVLPALVMSMTISGMLGLVIERIALRPLRNRRSHHLSPMIATIGFAIMIVSLSQGLFGAEAYRFPPELIPSDALVFGEIRVTLLQIVIVAISFFLMAAIFCLLRKSKWGKAVRAVADNPTTASLQGIPVDRVFALTSFVSSSLGGAAGMLTGLNFNAIHVYMGGPMLHRGIAVIILGGLGDIRGAMAGGMILGFSEVLSVAYFSSDFRDAVSFGLLFLILLIRPSGLFGKTYERAG